MLAAVRSTEHRSTTWARWNIVDAAGEPVGLVDEERQWAGSRYGPPTYVAVHNPSGAAWQALWRSEGHATVPAALAALQAHLDERA